MKRVLTLALLPLYLATAQPAPGDGGLFTQVDTITKKLAEITGWPLKRKVPAAMMSRQELDRYLNQKISKESKPQEIHAEELTLKALGFAPDDFDLKQSVLDVLGEQAAAFYDTKTRRLFVMESSAGDTPILVHELSHALADQHFSLDRFIRHAGKSDDAHLARMAVMEGQAMWLMAEWQAAERGGSLVGQREVINMMAKPNNASGQFPALEKSPLYLQETLLFPYTRGLVFQHAVIEKHGRGGYAEVFKNPPQTTQQILHPDAYFDARPAEAVTLPARKLPKGFKAIAAGNLGELDHQILLRQFRVSDWEPMAAGWRGAAYRVSEHRRQKRSLLEYASTWETEAAAQRFFEAYRRSVLPAKHNGYAEDDARDGLVRAHGAKGRVELTLRGRMVIAVEGL